MRMGFEPQDWDLGLQAGIWASRLRYGPGGWGEAGGAEEEEKEEKKEEKIPHMCESIGHRPLWGRCPNRKEGKEATLFNSFDILSRMQSAKTLFAFRPLSIIH